MDSLTRLQELLRSLFQYDESGDLDFGIYRLLRLKRDEVKAFLNDQLPRAVDEAFQAQAAQDRRGLEQRVGALADQIRRQIDRDALDADGSVKPEFADLPGRAIRALVEQYSDARAALQVARAGDEAKAEVFNHLYSFFSRYYEEGDFIPKRRYGVPEHYAVPYNGEETFFTRANRDQHYVKSGERFRDYTFTVPTAFGEYRVRFSLAEASTTPGNAKGETRFFFPLPERVEYDAARRALCIPFEYRVPNEEEAKLEVEDAEGRKLKGQEAILAQAESRLRLAIPDEVLATALGAPANGSKVEGSKFKVQGSTGGNGNGGAPGTVLLRRLRHFTRRNTSDYFIHKDLRGFLQRELEFYLKDCFLSVDDLHGDVPARLRALRVLRKIAGDVIAFLAQIEEFQKRVFEKRKLVLRADYLAPIRNVPRELWPEVLANQAQVEEWQRLYAINTKPSLGNPSGGLNEHFLEEHPTLVVSTAHFDERFTLRLLGGFEDLDEATDGLLVHSENYQALRFLLPRYAGSAGCIYLDAPYNTGSDRFAYKDRYQHSTWLAMMAERLGLAQHALSQDGAVFLSMDDHEAHALKVLADELLSLTTFVSDIAVVNNLKGRSDREHIATAHEHLFLYVSEGFETEGLPLSPEKVAEYSGVEPDGRRYQWRDLRKRGGNDTRQARPNLYFPIHANAGRGTFALERTSPQDIAVLPLKSDGTDGCWRWGKDKARCNLGMLRMEPTANPDRYNISYKVYLEVQGSQRTAKPKSVWMGSQYATDLGQRALKAALPNVSTDNWAPKAVGFLADVIQQSIGPVGRVLDFFAGSGTTGHAVINLNREDGGERKFILVEMADYFDTVLLPRIMKVMYTPEWQNGEPQRPATEEEAERTPRLVKVLRLESYEDALHNLATEEEQARVRTRARATKQAVGEDAYRLTYLMRLPRESGDSLLSLAKLDHPFDYTMETLTDDGPRVERVDLVETFNYLAGLRVHRVEAWTNPADSPPRAGGQGGGGREYRAVTATDREHRRVLVLWRDMAGLDPAVERAFLEPRVEAGGYDVAWINGDAAVKRAQSLDGEFARLMEEEVEA